MLLRFDSELDFVFWGNGIDPHPYPVGGRMCFAADTDFTFAGQGEFFAFLSFEESHGNNLITQLEPGGFSDTYDRYFSAVEDEFFILDAVQRQIDEKKLFLDILS